jgi:hypothetical protein
MRTGCQASDLLLFINPFLKQNPIKAGFFSTLLQHSPVHHKAFGALPFACRGVSHRTLKSMVEWMNHIHIEWNDYTECILIRYASYPDQQRSPLRSRAACDWLSCHLVITGRYVFTLISPLFSRLVLNVFINFKDGCSGRIRNRRRQRLTC